MRHHLAKICLLSLLLLNCGGCIDLIPTEKSPPLKPIENSYRDRLFPDPQGNTFTNVTVVGERTEMYWAVSDMSNYIENHGRYSSRRAPAQYGFNNGLDGIKVAELSDPTRTVMFYTGSDRQLSYSFMDKYALVAFADGTIKYVRKGDREQAEFLRW